LNAVDRAKKRRLLPKLAAHTDLTVRQIQASYLNHFNNLHVFRHKNETRLRKVPTKTWGHYNYDYATIEGMSDDR